MEVNAARVARKRESNSIVWGRKACATFALHALDGLGLFEPASAAEDAGTTEAERSAEYGSATMEFSHGKPSMTDTGVKILEMKRPTEQVMRADIRVLVEFVVHQYLREHRGFVPGRFSALRHGNSPRVTTIPTRLRIEPVGPLESGASQCIQSGKNKTLSKALGSPSETVPCPAVLAFKEKNPAEYTNVVEFVANSMKK
jgi:hypothetical protein